jgi:hypothetical protein
MPSSVRAGMRPRRCTITSGSGRPARSATSARCGVIEAIGPGVDSIPFVADSSALTFEVGQGCRQIGNWRQLGSEFWATEILRDGPKPNTGPLACVPSTTWTSGSSSTRTACRSGPWWAQLGQLGSGCRT